MMDPIVDGRPVAGFPTYRITPDGQVWTCLKRGPIGREYVLGEVYRPMRPSCCKPGGRRLQYLIVGLYKRSGDGKQYRFPVHRLMLETFVCSRPAGMQCRHHNGNHQDNQLDNLSWDTPLVNQHDRRIHGTTTEGMKHGRAKLTDEDVRKIREEYAKGGVRQVDLGNKYGIKQGHVTRLVRRVNWTHIKEQETSYGKT